MGSGIEYSGLEQLSVSLGSGADAFTIASTHATGTFVDGNGGADTIDVNGVAGAVTVSSAARATSRT
jgi:hypothetical protein